MTGTGAPTNDVASPFVGPRPFRQADADRFFARDMEAREIQSRWLADRIVVLHGPAAVGKTSLLQAGVLPLLTHADNLDLLQIGRLSHQSALSQPVAPTVNSCRIALLRSWAPLASPAQAASIADFLQSRRAVRNGEPRLILAAIDQLEELFTDFPARQLEREDLVAELAAAVREVPELRLLLVVRDDCLGELRMREQRFSPHPFSYIALPPLLPEAALDAVTRPLAGTGLSFSNDAAAQCISQVRAVTYTNAAGESATRLQDRVEPLFLQITCAGLWSSLRTGTRTITIGDIREFGDADMALARFYDAVIDEVQLETGTPAARLRTWIQSAFINEHGTRSSVNRGTSVTAGMPNDVADSFAQHHLLTAEHRTNSTWYQLIHDRLMTPIQQANRVWRSASGTQADEAPQKQTTPAAFAAAAQAALAEGRFPSARRFARLAATRYRQAGNDRRFARAMILQGDIARSAGDLSGAGESFRIALSTFAMLGDRNAIVRMLSALADVHFSVGDYRSAADLQRQAIGRLPSDVGALIGLGYAQWYGGSPANAEATFSQAVSGDPGAIPAFAGRGQVRVELQEYVAALADLNYALAAAVPSADEPDVRSARALALTALGRTEEAEQDLAVARGMEPGRARTLLRAGRIAAMRGQAKFAHEELKRALHAQPRLSPWDEAAARRLLVSLHRAAPT